jgi:hypothetical protein
MENSIMYADEDNIQNDDIKSEIVITRHRHVINGRLHLGNHLTIIIQIIIDIFRK